MPDCGFDALRRGLYEQGVATGYAERLVAELREHRADIEAERVAAGDARPDAVQQAKQRLGSDAAIVAQVLARPELRGRCSDVLAALRALQPLAAVGAQWLDGTVGAPAIARWTASVSLGFLMTVAMLFALAQSITLGV